MKSISNLTAIIYGLRFRFVPPRCVIRWGVGESRGREEGSPVSVFGAQVEKMIQESTEPSPQGGRAGDRCGPPLMNPSGPRIRFFSRRAHTRTRVRKRTEKRAVFLFTRAHTSAAAFYLYCCSLRDVKSAIRADGRTLRDASDYRIRRRSLMRSRPEEGPAADGTHD